MKNLKTIVRCHCIPWILTAAILAAGAITVSCAPADFDCYTDMECEQLYGGNF